MLEWLITLSWLTPLFFGVAALIGETMRRVKRKRYLVSKRDLSMIIFQIPTVGNFETVNRIFEKVKGYGLPIKIETWAVIEEGDNATNYKSDRVIVVPKSYQCFAHAKARALEYARLQRLSLVDMGVLPANYLIVQGDDDSTPSKGLLEEALVIEIDMISAMIEPTGGSRLTKITDYQRFYACTCTCQFAYNCNHPLWGHGEAMIYTAKVDRQISYEFIPLNGKILHNFNEVPEMGNEDMFFTHKAELAGFKFYKSEKFVEIQSPFTWRDLQKQRRRWLWGNFNIVYRKRWLPTTHAIRFVTMHLSGMCLYPLAKVGFILDIFNVIHLTPEQRLLSIAGFCAWYVVRFYSVARIKGWKAGLAAAVLSQVTTTLDYYALLRGVIKGDPKKFEVVRKVKDEPKLEVAPKI